MTMVEALDSSLALRNAIVAALIGAAMLTACRPSTPSQGSSVERAITHDGISRSYRVYAPIGHSSPRGLVLVLHGWKGSGAEIERRTEFRFDTLADRDGFVVAYPEALAGQWHSGHPAETATSDDVGFLSALIDTLSDAYSLDPKRIFVAGFSNGASMAYRLACERPDRIAAIAPVSGGLAKDLMPSCAGLSHRRIPLLLMHGTADPELRFDSGELEGNLAYWVRRNGCSTASTVSYLPDADPGDNTRTRIERYPDCKDGADVVLYAIEGGGHHWPDGDQRFRFQSRGNVPRDFDGASVIWDFLRKHPVSQ
jgi:polyhydroxybutyrate depolymerase